MKIMDDIVNIERMLEVGAESKEELKSGKEMLAQRQRRPSECRPLEFDAPHKIW